MFFGKKKSETSFSTTSLRRRFHHLLIAKRKEQKPRMPLSRPKRRFKNFPSPMRTFSQSPGFTAMRKFFVFILFGGLTLGLAYTAFLSNFFTITKAELQSPEGSVTQTSLTPFLQKQEGKNLLFINTLQLAREIEQTFKNDVGRVQVKKSYPHKLIVKVEEFPATLNLVLIGPEKTHKVLLNQIGQVMPQTTERKELPRLVVHTPKEIRAKTASIDKEKMALIMGAFQKFQNLFGLKVNEAEWLRTERELHLKTEKNFIVWIDLTADINKQLQKLKMALPKLDIYHEPLEYIDLRIAGTNSEKVIFKRRR